MPTQDKFGFRFWLFWILGLAGSFLVSAVFWTWAVSTFLGTLQQPELLVTWALSVFGCWFLILTPFMRKKERIWKRLNTDQEKATDAWLAGMGCFLAGLIAACFFWSWRLRAQVFQTPGFDPLWGKSVLGTWLVLTLPFLIFLYKKADAIFKAAHERQTRLGPRFQTRFLERSRRLLPENIVEKIKAVPEALEEGHVVKLKLRDGREIPNVFIFRGNEVLGLYDAHEMTFETRDVTDVEVVTALPQYEESRWLRLDGRA
jgi:hypothetical protein